MNKAWRFFSLDTGEVLPHTMVLPDPDTVAANTPAGFAAVSLLIDHLSQRVQLVTDDFGVSVPVLVDYQPPAPPETEWVTWSWSAERCRWVEVPTIAAIKRAHSEPLLQQLVQLDLKVARPAGEIAEALGLGLAPPLAAVERLQAINAEKADLRQQLAVIAAWTSPPA